MVVNGALEVVDYSYRVLAALDLTTDTGAGVDTEACGRGGDARADLTGFLSGDAALGDNLALATARLTRPADEESFRWTRHGRTYDVTICAQQQESSFLVVFADTTDQLMTEEIQLNARHYLEQVLGDIPVGVIVLNDQLRITSVNRHMLELLGQTGVEMDLVGAIGATLTESLPPDTGARLREMCADVLRTGERSAGWEHQHSTAAGDLVLTTEVTPLRDQASGVVGAIVISSDVTERRRLEQELVRMEKLATVGEMVVTVDHEINNPLSIISTNAQALRLLNRDLDEKATKKLLSIEEQVKRISEVTERLRSMDEVASQEYIADGPQMIDVWKRSAAQDDGEDEE